MLSNRPYLLRAFHEWIVDSACTPILVLNTCNPRCRIPQDYIDGDEIIFNISSIAVRDLKMTNDAIEFKASFKGIINVIYAPIQAVMAIYAEENGEGLFFDAEDEIDMDDTAIRPVKLTSIDGMAQGAVFNESLSDDASASGHAPTSAARSKPFLTLVE